MNKVAPEYARPSNQRIFVNVRVHAYSKDLDATWAKNILGLSQDDPVVDEVFEYDDGILGCRFKNDKQLSADELEQWHLPVFLQATKWLSARTKDQFQKIKDAGSKTDLQVVGYRGPIPTPLLKEITWLEIELYVMYY